MASLDADLDLESSADPANLDVDQPQGVVEAESSTATGETQADTLSIVRDVVDGKSKAEAASPAEGEEENGDKTEAPKKQDNADYSDVPFHQHPRFQQLLRDKKANEADAGRYRNIQGYLDQTGLSADNAADALLIAGMSLTNPLEAWNRLVPFAQKLAVAAGIILPDSLQQRVTAGELPPQAAQEISRLNAQAQSMAAQQAWTQERAARQAQQDQETAAQAQVQSLVEAATVWEQDRRTKDPHFDAKIVPLQKELAYLHKTEGVPSSPQGVRGQLKRAYDTVNENFRPPMAPLRSQAVSKAPIRGGQVAGTPRAAAKDESTLDIVRRLAAG